MPPQSSFLSSEEGDTEVLFTSDYPSSVQFCEEEEDSEDVDRKGLHIIPGRLDCVATKPALTRSRSLLTLGEIDSSTMPQSGQLYRVRSYPQLKGHGDKHVRWAGGTSNDGIDSTCSGFSGIDSKSSSGVYSSSSKAVTVKSKEIYVNFSYFSSGSSKHKHLAGLTGLGDTEQVGGSGEPGQVDVGTERLLNAAQTEGGNSLTASANGEIMGVSAVNSDVSPDSHLPEVEDLCSDKFSQRTDPSVLSTKSDVSLSVRSKLLSGVVDKLSSLPDLSNQNVSKGFSPISTELGTPSSVTKPSISTQPRPGGPSSLKTSPYRHSKKRVTIPGPGELHGSSVFSSTRYGPIVSAAESTTLSYVGSDPDVTDSSSSTTSITAAHVVEDLSQR